MGGSDIEEPHGHSRRAAGRGRRTRSPGTKSDEPWRALSRPAARPDIHGAVISRTRINLHRKIVKHAAFTGQYPIAVMSNCVV